MKLFDGRSEFYQYDLNQKLICDECAVGEEIHFSNHFFAKAAVCVTYDLDGQVVVDVPNAYLLSHGELTAYRVCCDGDQTSTADCCTFNVVARKKPSDYAYTETEVKSYEALEARIERLENGSFVGGGDGGTGKDGITPHIGDNGNWFLGDIDTGIKARGEDGQDGKDGIDGYTPVKGIDYFDGVDGKDGTSGLNGNDGADGITPHIGENKNWFIGDTDTGVRAEGKDGQDGVDGSSMEVYSTEETVVGTWIDGKPLYQKTVILPSLPNATKGTYDVGLSNVSYKHLSGFVEWSDGTKAPIPFTDYGNISAQAGVYMKDSDGTFVIVTGIDRSTLSATVHLRYTKNADTATIDIPTAAALMAAYGEGVQNA